jgi:hypothetical protein
LRRSEGDRASSMATTCSDSSASFLTGPAMGAADAGEHGRDVAVLAPRAAARWWRPCGACRPRPCRRRRAPRGKARPIRGRRAAVLRGVRAQPVGLRQGRGSFEIMGCVFRSIVNTGSV